MSRTLRALLLILIALVPRPLHGQAEPGDAVPVLVPGDFVEIQVWRKPDLSGKFQVNLDSTIAHPLYRNLKVAGVPMDVVRDRMHSVLSRYEANPEFVVTPLFSVAIGGHVTAPGLYQFGPEVTIANALATAGGPTDIGRLRRVRLERNGETYKLDLTRVDRGWNWRLHSGDQITVGRRFDPLRDYAMPIASIGTAVIQFYLLVRTLVG